jgi:hypothetical protein
MRCPECARLKVQYETCRAVYEAAHIGFQEEALTARQPRLKFIADNAWMDFESAIFELDMHRRVHVPAK